jgi:hypothetical protein
MSLLRVLIPSWKFFETPGQCSKLRYRQARPDGSLSTWQEIQPPQPIRNPFSLFLNAEENLWLAKSSLLDQLVFEFFEKSLPDLASLKDEASYKLVENWVRSELKPQSSGTFQFEIRIEDAVTSALSENLLSMIHEI